MSLKVQVHARVCLFSKLLHAEYQNLHFTSKVKTLLRSEDVLAVWRYVSVRVCGLCMCVLKINHHLHSAPACQV